MFFRYVCCLLLLFTGVTVFLTFFEPTVRADEEPAAQDAFVRDKVVPLLEARCWECHGNDDEPKGSLSLLNRQSTLHGGDSGPAIVPGRPEESLLVEAIRYDGLEMPPKSRLPDAEIRILVDWIRMGAPWPQEFTSSPAPDRSDEFPLEQRRRAHWAWKAIEDPPVPGVSNADWPLDPADSFVLAQLEQRGLTPAGDTDRATLLRRLSFDLIGLPPTISETEQFVSDPRDDDDVIADTVERLLASPHFGERWGRHWLDLVRYAETLGHEFDYPLHHAWQYRDYVIRAINSDVPWDDFLREHIAGDLLEKPRRNPDQQFNESVIGTGFWFLHEAKHAPVDVMGDQAVRFDNQIDVFSRAFMGLTVACARCHDHKFDAIQAADYYALAGFLKSSRRTTVWLDPGLQIDGPREQLAELAEKARVLQRQWRDAEESAEQLRAAALTLSDDQSSPPNAEAASDLSHPLSLIARLKQANDADACKVAQEWAAEIRAAESASQDSLVFADFSSGVPDGWTAAGPAFAEFPRTNAVVPGDVPHPVATEGVSSADLSGHLGGTLASESFELNHPEILVRIAAENARLRLVIEGYVMMEFSALLFQGCTQKVSTDGKFEWIRIAGDVHRHRGRRAHLEIVDEGDGWFVADQVRFVDRPGAAPPVHHVPQSSRHLAAALHEHPVGDPWELAGQHLWPALFNAGLLPSSVDPQWTDLNAQWKAIAEQTPRGTPVLAMTEGTPAEQPVYIRGNHRNPGEVAPRTFLTAISGRDQPPISNGSGRAELAERLLDDSNPFPARVAVNRVWHHLFGRGIVASTDDFGVLGERPTHPQLLDHLATRFRNSNWSTKRLIGELVRSRAYRMKSHPNVAAQDPTGIWLASARVRRLQAEVIRDAILKISGRLDSQCCGPSVPVALTPEMDGRGRPSGGPLDGNGRRSIYISVNRNFLSPFQQTFDRPAPVTTVGKRTVSNVPAQALILLNSEFVQQQAALWAQQLRKDLSEADAQGGAEETIRRTWQEACGRQPADQEVESLREFCRQQAIAHAEPWDGRQIPPATLNDLCHVLFNIKEFIYLR